MNLTFSLSLKQRTLANIAVMLWNQDDVRDLMSKPSLQILFNNWHETEKAVIEKSFKLQLPNRLQENLLDFIVRVGLQILSWIDLHHRQYELVTKLPATFVWTSLGTINNVSTAKLLVMGGTLNNENSFALACMYCLENEIKYYWNVLQVSGQGSKFLCIRKGYYVSDWITYMEKLYKEDDMSLTYSPEMNSYSLIRESVSKGNEAVIKYLYNVHMKPYEYVKILTELVDRIFLKFNDFIMLQRYSSIMLFLLSKINVEQQTNMIVKYTFTFLNCLLVWPWHSLFLEVAKDMWNSLSEKQYSDLLYNMVTFMRYEPNLHKIFEEFWQQSPEAYKRLFTDDSGNIVKLLIKLSERGDEKNVKLILKDLSISIKKNILLNTDSKSIFSCLVSSNKWDLIKFLIQECLLSREDLITFRDLFKNNLFKNFEIHELLSENAFFIGGYSRFEIIAKYDQWNKFFQLVNDCISGYNNKKRRHIGESTSSKIYL